MTLCIRDIHWLAGLMEGEGCFTTFTNGKSQKKYPRLMLNMCDRDVVERANQFFKGSFYTRSKKRSDKHQPSYCLQLTRASEVVGWMMTLYPLFGERRQQRIREILADWRRS